MKFLNFRHFISGIVLKKSVAALSYTSIPEQTTERGKLFLTVSVIILRKINDLADNRSTSSRVVYL